MPLRLIMMIMGGCFVVLGIIFYFWGKAEEGRYYDTIIHRPDVREYMEHAPSRPEPGALRTGGIIALVLGILLIAAGGGLWLFAVDVW